MFARASFFPFAALWWQFYPYNKGNGSGRVWWNEEVCVLRETESSSHSKCCWCLESGSEPKYLLTPGGMLFSVTAILSFKSPFANMNLFCIKSILKAPEVQYPSFSQLVFAASRYASFLQIIIKLWKFPGIWIMKTKDRCEMASVNHPTKGGMHLKTRLLLSMFRNADDSNCAELWIEIQIQTALSESQMGFWWNRGVYVMLNMDFFLKKKKKDFL